MRILISPWSRKLINGKENAKNYPYWAELSEKLQELGHYIIQIGLYNEKLIGANECKFDLSLIEIKELSKKCDLFISVDNFIPHLLTNFCNGIVLWSVSDPQIFGYVQNINLLKDRNYLKQNQFTIWEEEEFNKDSHVNVYEVLKAVNSFSK